MSEENIAAVPSKRLKKVAVDTMPAQVTLTAPFGYYDEAGDLQHWQAGFTETDASKITDLISRGAPLENQ